MGIGSYHAKCSTCSRALGERNRGTKNFNQLAVGRVDQISSGTARRISGGLIMRAFSFPHVQHLAALATLFLLCGCGAMPDQDTVANSEPLGGGQVDTGYPAVGCINSCTGTLIAPDLVLTAKHCGSMINTKFVVGPSCAQTGNESIVDYEFVYFPDEGTTDSEYTTRQHDLRIGHITPPLYNIRPLSINTKPLPQNQTCIAVGYGGSGVKSSGSMDIVKTGGVDTFTIRGGMANALEVVQSNSPPPGFPPGADQVKGDSGGPLLCNGVIVGTATAVTMFNSGDGFYTAIDPDVTHDAWWIANVASDYVNEPILSVVTGGPDIYDLFARATDGQLLYNQDNGAFNWTELGGFLTGTPDAVTSGGNHIDVFVRGGDPNPQTDNPNSTTLWHLAFNGPFGSGPHWDPWPLSYDSGSPGSYPYPTTARLIGHPSAVAWPPYNVAVFAVDANQNVDFRYWDGSSWSPWTGLSPYDADTQQRVSFLGPVKAMNGTVFAVGTNHSLYASTFTFYSNNNGRFTQNSWTNLGGYIQGGVSVVANAVNAFNVFVKSSDNRVYDKSSDQWGNWWPSQAGWEGLGGSLWTSPVVGSYHAGELMVIGLGNGKDSLLDWREYNGGWTASFSPILWNSVGSPALVALPNNSQFLDVFTVGNNFLPGYIQYEPTYYASPGFGPVNTVDCAGCPPSVETVSPW